MILADENIDFNIIKYLRENNFDVLSVRESFSGIKDDEVIKLSKETNRIILTEDKDFGEWVFAKKEINISVILLRYVFKDKDLIKHSLLTILNNKNISFKGKFLTLTVKKVRIKDLAFVN